MAKTNGRESFSTRIRVLPSQATNKRQETCLSISTSISNCSCIAKKIHVTWSVQEVTIPYFVFDALNLIELSPRSSISPLRQQSKIMKTKITITNKKKKTKVLCAEFRQVDAQYDAEACLMQFFKSVVKIALRVTQVVLFAANVDNSLHWNRYLEFVPTWLSQV